MNEFSLNIYSNKAEELRQETEATFEQMNLATDVLPATMQPDDGAIKLVFCRTVQCRQVQYYQDDFRD